MRSKWKVVTQEGNSRWMKRDKKFIGGLVQKLSRENRETYPPIYIYIYICSKLVEIPTLAVEDSETRDEEVNSLIYPPLTG